MKKILVKCSDERSRRYSIITTIIREGDEKFVLKEAVYPEGQEHIRDLITYRDVLSKAYPQILPCPVRLEDGKAVFDFIEGRSLESEYNGAVESGDPKAFERVLDRHCAILCANPENDEIFSPTEEYRAWFGSAAEYEGKPGFRAANFDAIPGNIIFTESRTCFIDYEWTMDFSMPKDLVIYHCVRDFYYHNDHAEEFYPLEKAMHYLGVGTDIDLLQKSYEHFFTRVIKDPDGRSFGLVKHLAMKEQTGIGGLLEEKARADESAEFAHRMWRECSAAVFELQGRLDRIDDEWEKKYVLQDATWVGKYNALKIGTDQAYADLMKEYQVLNRDRDIWKSRYEAVTATKAYKTAEKVRKVLKKG
ncbi:MAG: hypothetical protein J6D46_08445 [Lachnospiraceae bacterium]|nr:hypothetical protein [Lachnospiraceae bacterium]